MTLDQLANIGEIIGSTFCDYFDCLSRQLDTYH